MAGPGAEARPTPCWESSACTRPFAGRAPGGLLVRRTRRALEPLLRRAREIYGPMGAIWLEGDKSRFEWPGGAVLYCKHLDNDADADLYQGHDYTRVYVEEMTQFHQPGPINKLKATLRSAAGVPCRFRATCNPGGPGHNWVKARYIEPGPYAVTWEEYENPFDHTTCRLDRMFIPARLCDNPRLLAVDPRYVATLQQSGSAELVRAWLEGDWNVIQGAFFDKWSNRNIVAPFLVPPYWSRFRAFDWGYAAPFSVGWWAVASDDHHVAEGVIPRGAMVRYREWYGVDPRTGAGLRLDAEAVAAGILERETERQAGAKVDFGVADPSMFACNGGPSIAERFARAGLRFAPADNTRVPRAGAMSGWAQVRARIKGDGARPMLYVFDSCADFIRTVPVLQHDPTRPEDIDTEAEDHIADETRYACLSRPMIAPVPKRPEPGPSGWDWDRLRREDAMRGLNWKTM